VTVTALQRSTDPIQRLMVVPAPTDPPPPGRSAESARGGVRYKHRTPVHCAPAPPRPDPRRDDLRLTRRGRLAVTAAVLAAVVGPTALAATTGSGGGAVGPVPVAPARGGPTIVVAAGDTLWRIALRSDPRADPRLTVARLVALNGLTGPIVRPGQQLHLPASR